MTDPKYLQVESAGQRWLLPCDDVLDVREMTVDAVVPGCPPFLPGMLAHRGRLIAIVRLDGLLGGGAAPAAPGRRLVVLRHETDPLALAVGEVSAATDLTSPVDPDLGWDLPDEVALIARGTTPSPFDAAATSLVLDVASFHRFVRSSCYKFWQKAPPPGCSFPAPRSEGVI